MTTFAPGGGPGRAVNSIRVFDPQEWQHVRECLEGIGQAGSPEARSARAGLQVLLHLAKAIALCPPLLRPQKLGGAHRSAATLAHLLSRRAGRNDLLNLPTKAVLGHSFQVAKINYLFLLRHLGRATPNGLGREQIFLDLIFLNVLTLMSEELLFAILQDEEVSGRVHARAAARLTDLWEHRLSWRARDLAPIIHSLWSVRGQLPPADLNGTGAMMGLLERAHPAWGRFLGNGGETAVPALEEFLFDLSYEEILRARGAGKEGAQPAGKQPSGAEAAPAPDPREFFRFFRRRRRNAALRRRAGLPGPRKTIEEMLLSYLLSGEMEVLGPTAGPAEEPAAGA